MVDNAWFRLFLRGIGILLIAIAAPNVVQSALYAAHWASNSAMMGGAYDGFWWTIGGSLLGSVSQTAFGIYLLFFGEGLIRRCLADTIGRCPVCQYDLKGRRTGRCPECGTDLDPIGSPATTSQVPPVTEPKN